MLRVNRKESPELPSNSRPEPNRIYEDWGHAIIEFESGAVGVYETSQVGEETIKYRQIMGTKGVITDVDFWTADFPLRALVNGEMKDIPIETRAA